MITALDTTSWAQADLDGNGEFLEIIIPGSPPIETLYVVSNVRANNTFTILESTSSLLGAAFNTVATYHFPFGAGSPPYPNTQFAPCISYDPNAVPNPVIHIIGLRNNLTNPRFFDLLKFTFDTVAQVFINAVPTVLATSSLIRSGFDIITLANSHTVVGAILTDATGLPGQSIVIYELDTTDAVVSTTILATSPDRAPDPTTLTTYNSLSLAVNFAGSPPVEQVELYWEQHPRLITYKDQLFQIFYALRDTTGTWGPIAGSPPAFAPTPIEAFTGRYSDDRLTVIQDTQGTRYLAQIFYNQTNIPEGIVGNLLLGVRLGGPDWDASVSYTVSETVNVQGVSYIALAANMGMFPPSNPNQWGLTQWFFHETPGSIVGGSIVEATLSLDTVGTLYVAYLIEDLLTGQLGGPGFDLNLALVNPVTLALTNVPGFYNNLQFTWLRGTKSILDSATDWAVVAETQTGQNPLVDTPSYLSGLNVPPVAILSPTVVTVERGTGQLFDASASYDPDGDPIVYQWAETSPDLVNVSIASATNGETAVLSVARAIGGGPRNFAVSVSEADTFPPFPISQVQVSAGLLTVTAPNDFVPLEFVGFENLQAAQFLNGFIGQILGVTQAGSPPAGVSFTISTSFPDYGPLADTGTVGLIRHLPAGGSVASAAVTVPFDPPPYIEFLNSPPYPLTGSPPLPTIFAGRNALVSIVPTYFPNPLNADGLYTYQWTQLTGDTVVPLSFTTPDFTFNTNGLSVDGELLTFEIQFNDGVTTNWVFSQNYAVGDSVFYGGQVWTAFSPNVNVPPPGSPPAWTLVGENPAFIQVAVASYQQQNPSYVADTLRISRALFQQTTGSPPVTSNAPISLRNTTQNWSFLEVSGVWNNLENVKRNSVIGGEDREIIISPASVLLYGGVVPNMTLLRRCLTPDATQILDAFHTEQDYTLLLASDPLNPTNQVIYRYSTSAFVDDDNPDTAIQLINIAAEMTFDAITATVSHNNIRVIALSGPQGALLLQVNSQTMAVEGFTALTVESKILYGADNVLWIRMANVETVHTGMILIGTVATAGSPPVSNTYETLYDLTFGITLGVWDKTKLINQYVATGEILFETISTYGGFPIAPVMNVPTAVDGIVNLTWSEVRPDLINSYTIFYSSDGGNSYTQIPVGSGSIQSIQLQLIPGVLYQFFMVASNNDGVSAASNIVSVQT